MKKLGKLEINPDKIMKNEELVSLRGGYSGPCGSSQGWNCTVTACQGCTPYSGIACGSQSVLDSFSLQQQALLPGWTMSCESRNDWNDMPIGTLNQGY